MAQLTRQHNKPLRIVLESSGGDMRKTEAGQNWPSRR